MGVTDNESIEPITRVEHNPDAAAKRVLLRAQDPSSGSWVNIAAVDNGDGTFSLSTTATLDGSDIEIGAVEIKDGDSDTRLDVESSGTKNAAYVQSETLATAANQATGNASLSVLDDWDETDRAKVNPIVGQAGVTGGAGNTDSATQRVVIASNQAVVPTYNSVSSSATGTTVARFTALTNTAQAVKASAGNVYGYHLSNQANPAQDLYVHLYNVAAASVVVGTTTPSRSYFLPGGAVIDTPYCAPMAFGTAISIAVSTTATGGTAPTNAIYAHVEYI